MNQTLRVAILICIMTFLGLHNTFAQDLTFTSPDQSVIMSISVGEKINFALKVDDVQVMTPSTIAMSLFDDHQLGENAKLIHVDRRNVDQMLYPELNIKSNQVRDQFNELVLSFENFRLSLRAYNNGVAYRFETDFDREIIILSEDAAYNFSEESRVYFPREKEFFSHNECLYEYNALDTLSKKDLCSLPVLVETNSDIKLLITETGLFDYPGMWLTGSDGNSLKATFPPYAIEVKEDTIRWSDGRSIRVSKKADYIAKTAGKRVFPWRIICVSRTDGDLITNQLAYQLATPARLIDDSWIRPGKVAWDWYNANNIFGVGFPAGINTETYKYYIDFASEYGLEYVILDEGWSKTTTEIQDCNPDINVKELVEYGKEKDVGIILWTLWGPLDNDMSTLEIYESWGVKGVKVDFMQRADQYMVNFYERVAKEAAEHHLLVDFHGSFKPSGLRRAYPNVVSYEGVKGNENNKWSHDITPEHNVTLPFIRMVAGPMDYTPGAMINATADNHRISFNRPMSLGTRCHQVAMYVVYESPLQMLCESPSTYYKEEITTRFISKIPTVWDETIVLDAKVADYILIARRKDDIWYLGAMTDWTPRELEIDFSFLDKGTYSMEVMSDGMNTNRYSQDFHYETMEINNTSIKKIKLASGGGWAAIITKR